MANGFLMPYKVWIGEVASATGNQTVTGLPFTPDVVLATAAVEGLTVGWSATSTTLTLTKSGTTASGVSFIAAKVS